MMKTKRSLFLQWCESGAIPASKTDIALRASGILPTHKAWRQFISNLLLWTGIMSLAFSVIFFIAYNWNNMGRFSKFGLIQISILLALMGYWKLGPSTTSGKSLLTMAAILLGGLLALFGQTYQTGADPWQLFAGWSVLILPWVIIADFVPLWLIWVGLVNISLYLYFTLFPGFWGLIFSFESLLFIIFLFNSVVLIVWEFAGKHLAWLQRRWAIRSVAVLSGAAVTGMVIQAVLDTHETRGWCYVVYPFWIGTIYFTYRRILQDLFMLAMMCLSLIIAVTAILSRALLHHSDAGGFLLIAMVVIGMSAASAVWLKRVNEEMIG